MPKKKTFEEVKSAFEERGYELLESEYINSTTKMKFKCPKHPDLDTKIRYKQLNRGEGCYYCGHERTAEALSEIKRKYSFEYVKEVVGSNGCILLSTSYKNAKQPLTYQCRCGEICKTNFSNYKKQSGVCKSCSMKENAQRIWTNETVSEYFEKQGCKLLSVYKEQNQNLKYICNCGNESRVKLGNFINGNRCKECANNKLRLKYEDVRSLFVKNNCVLLSTDYKNSTTQKLDYICSCGNRHSIRFLAFRRGERCPQCKSISKGEKTIQSYLEGHQINFKYQYKIDECKNILPLPFDFAILKKGKLKCLIEFDGKQHFKPIKQFGGEEYFQKIKHNDAIKNKFCNENDIPLYRINYKEYKKIEERLDEIILMEV